MALGKFSHPVESIDRHPNAIKWGKFAPLPGWKPRPISRPALRVVTRALATARIAVYPIDVAGNTDVGRGYSVGAAESASFAGTSNPQHLGKI